MIRPQTSFVSSKPSESETSYLSALAAAALDETDSEAAEPEPDFTN
jgi:hypothetical protein